MDENWKGNLSIIQQQYMSGEKILSSRASIIVRVDLKRQGGLFLLLLFCFWFDDCRFPLLRLLVAPCHPNHFRPFMWRLAITGLIIVGGSPSVTTRHSWPFHSNWGVVTALQSARKGISCILFDWVSGARVPSHRVPLIRCGWFHRRQPPITTSLRGSHAASKTPADGSWY